MAKYNTFVLVNTKNNKNMLVSSSIRKLLPLTPGSKIEVWCENKHIKTIYSKTGSQLKEYIQAEKEYIRQKQMRAEKKRYSKKLKESICEK